MRKANPQKTNKKSKAEKAKKKEENSNCYLCSNRIVFHPYIHCAFESCFGNRTVFRQKYNIDSWNRYEY